MSEKDIVEEMLEFRRVVAAFTGLSVLLIGKVITENEFIAYLREVVCEYTGD